MVSYQGGASQQLAQRRASIEQSQRDVNAAQFQMAQRSQQELRTSTPTSQAGYRSAVSKAQTEFGTAKAQAQEQVAQALIEQGGYEADLNASIARENAYNAIQQITQRADQKNPGYIQGSVLQKIKSVGSSAGLSQAEITAAIQDYKNQTYSTSSAMAKSQRIADVQQFKIENPDIQIKTNLSGSQVTSMNGVAAPAGQVYDISRQTSIQMSKEAASTVPGVTAQANWKSINVVPNKGVIPGVTFSRYLLPQPDATKNIQEAIRNFPGNIIESWKNPDYPQIRSEERTGPNIIERKPEVDYYIPEKTGGEVGTGGGGGGTPFISQPPQFPPIIPPIPEITIPTPTLPTPSTPSSPTPVQQSIAPAIALFGSGVSRPSWLVTQEQTRAKNNILDLTPVNNLGYQTRGTISTGTSDFTTDISSPSFLSTAESLGGGFLSIPTRLGGAAEGLATKYANIEFSYRSPPTISDIKSFVEGNGLGVTRVESSIPREVGAAATVAPYFIPVVGEALMIGGGSVGLYTSAKEGSTKGVLLSTAELLGGSLGGASLLGKLSTKEAKGVTNAFNIDKKVNIATGVSKDVIADVVVPKVTRTVQQEIRLDTAAINLRNDLGIARVNRIINEAKQVIPTFIRNEVRANTKEFASAFNNIVNKAEGAYYRSQPFTVGNRNLNPKELQLYSKFDRSGGWLGQPSSLGTVGKTTRAIDRTVDSAFYFARGKVVNAANKVVGKTTQKLIPEFYSRADFFASRKMELDLMGGKIKAYAEVPGKAAKIVASGVRTKLLPEYYSRADFLVGRKMELVRGATKLKAFDDFLGQTVRDTTMGTVARTRARLVPEYYSRSDFLIGRKMELDLMGSRIKAYAGVPGRAAKIIVSGSKPIVARQYYKVEDYVTGKMIPLRTAWDTPIVPSTTKYGILGKGEPVLAGPRKAFKEGIKSMYTGRDLINPELAGKAKNKIEILRRTINPENLYSSKIRSTKPSYDLAAIDKADEELRLGIARRYGGGEVTAVSLAPEVKVTTTNVETVSGRMSSVLVLEKPTPSAYTGTGLYERTESTLINVPSQKERLATGYGAFGLVTNIKSQQFLTSTRADNNLNALPDLGLKVDVDVKSIQDYIGIQKQRTNQEVSVIQDVGQVQDFGQIQIGKQKQEQKADQGQKSKQREGWISVPREDKKYKKIIIKDIPEQPTVFGTKKKKLLKKGLGFEPLVRKKGRFIPISGAAFSTREEAMAVGAEKVLGTARASFKIIPSSKPVVSTRRTITSKFPAFFRPSKKLAGTFVQRKTTRITSPGEIREISLVGARASKAARSNRIKNRRMFGI